MKSKKLSLLCLSLIVCLLFSACPQPKKRTIQLECNPRTRQCVIRVTIEYLGPVSQINNQIFSNTGILDLANPWQPDTSQNSSVNVKVLKANGQLLQSSFTTQFTSNGNIASVDKDTTPRFYVIQNPNDVSNFIGQSLVGESDANLEAEFVIPITQIDCALSSGAYLNHLRYSDPSGVTYIDPFVLIYSIPANVQGANACEESTITAE